MGGTKRKIAMEKINKKDSRSVAFSKRRNGLYSKATDLCQLSGSQIAILTTPISSNSNVSFYSYGHCSVDSVVSAFLANERPKEDVGSKFWFEKEGLGKLENSDELTEAVDSVSRMLESLKVLESELNVQEESKKTKKKKNRKKKKGVDQNQTLNLPSISDSSANCVGCVQNSEEETQIVAISDNNNDLLGNLDGCDQEFDFDQFIDFVNNSESLFLDLEVDDASMIKTTVEEEPVMMIERDLDEDNLQFADVCNKLPSIALL